MPKRKNGQLTAGDRMTIDQGLRDSERIPDIARRIGVAPSTVTREVKLNSVTSSPSFLVVESRNICLRKDVCHHHGLRDNGCIMSCRKCSKSLCNKVCPEFLPNKCPWLKKTLFVCNDCRRRYGMGCEYEYCFYDGKLAHGLAQKRKVESRQGIDCTREELKYVADFVRPLLKKGQSPESIWLNFGDQLPFGLRTFYHYVEIGVFENIINLTLPKKCASSSVRNTEMPTCPDATSKDAHTKTSKRIYRKTSACRPSRWTA